MLCKDYIEKYKDFIKTFREKINSSAKIIWAFERAITSIFCKKAGKRIFVLSLTQKRQPNKVRHPELDSGSQT